jgi:hypothetical protein
MPTNSFTWWLINLAVAIGFIAIAIASGEWLFAFGGLISAGLMMMNELAGSSTEEGSAEELPSLVLPPASVTSGPYHSEEELGGESKG